MAVVDKTFIADGTVKIFNSDWEIYSKSHIKLWVDSAEVPTDQYDVIEHSAVFFEAPADGSTVIMQVATTPGDLLESPTDISKLVDNLDELLAIDYAAIFQAADTIDLNIATLEGYVADASSSASQSATNATNSSTSATNAATSESNAATSATAAATSASDASLSASNAATSESNASTSAAAAATSESNASISATNASTSESNASTSEANASTSESNAATSATNAATSATNASTSENNAADSATSASTSATSASTSAASASSSASTATTQAGIATTKASEASSSASAAAISESNASTSATNAATSESNAAASLLGVETLYDAFDDRYLGSKISEPTLDNDGNALTDGALFFNTTTNLLCVYDLSTTTWLEIPNMSLAVLSDVSLTSIATGEIIKWNGSNWINVSLATEIDTLLPIDVLRDTSTHTVTNKTLNDISNNVGANHIHYKVKASEALVPGDVVTITGYNAGENAVEVSKTTSITDVAVGIVEETMAIGEFGSVINTGTIEDIDTSDENWTFGTILYSDGAGSFTHIKPTTGYYQAAAVVLRQQSNTGSLLVEFTEPKATQAEINSGVSITESQISNFGTYEPADSTILKDVDGFSLDLGNI